MRKTVRGSSGRKPGSPVRTSPTRPLQELLLMGEEKLPSTAQTLGIFPEGGGDTVTNGWAQSWL